MNEELAIVLSLVIAIIGIVLAYTFMMQGTDSTIGSMDFVDEYAGDRDIQNQEEDTTSTTSGATGWQRDYRSPQESL